MCKKRTRVETYPFAREAVREAVYNALIHSDWSDNNPIQIRIEDEVMYISNSSLLPHDFTLEMLMHSHRSMPLNPEIADVLERPLEEKILQPMRNVPDCVYDALAEYCICNKESLRKSLNKHPESIILSETDQEYRYEEFIKEVNL